MFTDERPHLQELLRVHRKNLDHLELQAAQHGHLNIPLPLKNEIENEKAAINTLETRIQLAESASETSIYGIKITDTEYDKVQDRFILKGIYHIKPTGSVVRILEQSPNTLQYWPKKTVVFDEKHKNWQVSVGVSKSSKDNRNLLIVTMEDAGNALCNYFDKVGQETGKWPGIVSLTPDIVI